MASLYPANKYKKMETDFQGKNCEKKLLQVELEKFGKSYSEVAQFFSLRLWQESKGKSLF